MSWNTRKLRVTDGASCIGSHLTDECILNPISAREERIVARAVYPILAALITVAACGPGEVVMECSPYASPEQLAERPSPYDSAAVVVDSASLKICYSRPFARGRVVFGGLVPLDTLWRTGANEPTILLLGLDAEVAGLPVKRGKYSIYTVPGETEWTIVLNAATRQWGQTRDMILPDGTESLNSYTPDVRAREVGRARVETRSVEYTEQFTARFEQVAEGRVELWLEWENTRVVVPVRFRDP